MALKRGAALEEEEEDEDEVGFTTTVRDELEEAPFVAHETSKERNNAEKTARRETFFTKKGPFYGGEATRAFLLRNKGWRLRL